MISDANVDANILRILHISYVYNIALMYHYKALLIYKLMQFCNRLSCMNAAIVFQVNVLISRFRLIME